MRHLPLAKVPQCEKHFATAFNIKQKKKKEKKSASDGCEIQEKMVRRVDPIFGWSKPSKSQFWKKHFQRHFASSVWKQTSVAAAAPLHAWEPSKFKPPPNAHTVGPFPPLLPKIILVIIYHTNTQFGPQIFNDEHQLYWTKF